MKSVEELIGELLLRHNCVIVPSFGGFVAKQMSARIDFEHGTMLPPSKSLLFNRQLVNNDGLLINELAQANELTFDQASIQVRHKISGWNELLKQGGRIEIDKVGHLFYDAESNICFEQDRFFNLLLESYGLGKVHFLTEEDVKIVEHTIQIIDQHEKELKEKPVSIVEEQEVVEVKEENPVIKETPILKPEFVVKDTETDKEQKENVEVVEHPTSRKRKNSAWRYVAAACLLPIAFYSFWIPLKTDVLESGVISINDFNPFHSSDKAIYSSEFLPATEDLQVSSTPSLHETINSLPASSSTYTMKYDEGHFITVNLPEKEVAEDNNVEKEKEKVVVKANAMHYIVGCFGNKSNAQKLVRKLKKKGLDAHVVGYSNGLHRVASGSAISEEEMSNIAARSKQLGFPGWILR